MQLYQFIIQFDYHNRTASRVIMFFRGILDEDSGMKLYACFGFTMILGALTVRYYIFKKPMKEILSETARRKSEEETEPGSQTALDEKNDRIILDEKLEINAVDEHPECLRAKEELTEEESQSKITKDWEEDIRKIHERMAERKARMEELLKTIDTSGI